MLLDATEEKLLGVGIASQSIINQARAVAIGRRETQIRTAEQRVKRRAPLRGTKLESFCFGTRKHHRRVGGNDRITDGLQRQLLVAVGISVLVCHSCHEIGCEPLGEFDGKRQLQRSEITIATRMRGDREGRLLDRIEIEAGTSGLSAVVPHGGFVRSAVSAHRIVVRPTDERETAVANVERADFLLLVAAVANEACRSEGEGCGQIAQSSLADVLHTAQISLTREGSQVFVAVGIFLKHPECGVVSPPCHAHFGCSAIVRRPCRLTCDVSVVEVATQAIDLAVFGHIVGIGIFRDRRNVCGNRPRIDHDIDVGLPAPIGGFHIGRRL